MDHRRVLWTGRSQRETLYRSVLAVRLYPQPHDVRFKYCPVQADSGILGIRIPAQPVDNLPVLVKGMPAPRRNRVEGAYFELFRRQFDRNVSIDPSTLHVNLNHLFR